MQRQLRDGIVVLAMSVIAASLGYILFRQFDLGLGLSLVTALAVYVALICLHVSLRRSEQTAGLRAEVAELEHQLAMLRQNRQGAAGVSGGPEPALNPAFAPAAQAGAAAAQAVPPGAVIAQRAAQKTPRTAAAAKPPPGAASPRIPSQVDAAIDRAQKAAAEAVRARAPRGGQGTPSAPPTKARPAPVSLARQASPPQRPDSAAITGTSGARLDVDRIEGLIRRLADDLSDGDASQGAATSAVAKPGVKDNSEGKLPVGAGKVAPLPSLPEKSAGDLDPMISALRTVSERMRAASTRPKRAAAPSKEKPAPTASSPQQDVPPRSNEMGVQPVAKVAERPQQASPVPQEAGTPVVAALAEAIERERIDLYLQPIFGLEQRRAKHFELSARLRDGSGVPMLRAQYASQLSDMGLLPQVDLAVLAAAGKIVRRLVAGGKSHNLFSNVASESLADDAFLEAFGNELRMQDNLSGHFVVSFDQSSVHTFAPAHWDTLSTLAGLGFRFSLEAVTNLDMDLEQLKKNGFAFVKLDADVFLRGLTAGETVVPSADICRHLANLGFGLIVDGIGDEASLGQLQRDGVLLGQGVLLGEAKPVKAEILADAPKSNAA